LFIIAAIRHCRGFLFVFDGIKFRVARLLDPVGARPIGYTCVAGNGLNCSNCTASFAVDIN